MERKSETKKEKSCFEGKRSKIPPFDLKYSLFWSGLFCRYKKRNKGRYFEQNNRIQETEPRTLFWTKTRYRKRNQGRYFKQKKNEQKEILVWIFPKKQKWAQNVGRFSAPWWDAQPLALFICCRRYSKSPWLTLNVSIFREWLILVYLEYI